MCMSPERGTTSLCTQIMAQVIYIHIFAVLFSFSVIGTSIIIMCMVVVHVIQTKQGTAHYDVALECHQLSETPQGTFEVKVI